jgi:predicted TIM-barrel fold metal-dependent hydrolase
MGIIDINSHYFAREGDIEAYRRLVQDPQIERIIVSAANLRLPRSDRFPLMSTFCATNEQLLDMVAAVGSAKLIPFCFIYPLDKDGPRQIEHAPSRGFRGLKMYPPMGFRPDQPEALDAFRAAEALRLPVFLHMGRTAPHPQLRSEFARPIHLEGLGLACPDLPVIIGHFGAPWQREASHIGAGFKNFYFDISTSGSWDVAAIRYVMEPPYMNGAGRMLLGTNGRGDNNLKLIDEALARLQAGGLNDEQMRRITHDNAAALLGP